MIITGDPRLRAALGHAAGAAQVGGVKRVRVLFIIMSYYLS